MLTELKIQNVVLIDSLHLTWEKGFTSITGETGAGKSIFINALKILSGMRIQSDLIRQGQEQLAVEATFHIHTQSIQPTLKALLQEHELLEETLEGGVLEEVILERRLSKAGKSRCRINGSVVTQGVLGKVSEQLFDLHGQHQQQSLFKASTHLAHLDGYAGLQKDLVAFQRQYETWKSLHQELVQLKKDAEDMSAQRDFLQYQLEELEKAELQEGEDQQIEERIKLLSGREKILELLNKMESYLHKENGALDQVQHIQSTLEQFSAYSDVFSKKEKDEGKGSGQQELQEAKALLESFSERLSQYVLPDATQPLESIDHLHARASQLQRLRTKYKKDLSELITLRDQRQKEINLLTDSSVYQQDIELKIKDAFTHLSKLALGLQAKRLEASIRFEKAVNNTLKHLGMEHSTFSCQWKHSKPNALDISSLSSYGADQLEFFLAANPGSSAQPLQKVASGGEASRVMLAIKSILAESDPVPLMVFDEIDTGIGGETANRVGECLQKLGQHHQIFVITHLHQVACRAKEQVRVAKSVVQEKTTTEVSTLSQEERIEELARMMGNEGSTSTLEHARELLEPHSSFT
jgi:DNA repair protein RecN (Recombination protein N)